MTKRKDYKDRDVEYYRVKY